MLSLVPSILQAGLLLALAGGPEDPSGTKVPLGTHGGFLTVHVGSSRPLRTIEYDDPVGGGSPLIEEAIGVHTGGDSSGFAVELVLQQSVGLDASTFVFAPRFGADIALSEWFGVYLSPSLALGYRMIKPGGLNQLGPDDSQLGHQATIQFALGTKIIVVDRLVLSFRPIGIDLAIPSRRYSDNLLAVRWQLVGGLGFTF